MEKRIKQNPINSYFNNSNNINPLTSPGEVVTVFAYPYLSAGAPAQGETKGLIKILFFKL